MKNVKLTVKDIDFDKANWVKSKGAKPGPLSTATIKGAIAALVHEQTRGKTMFKDEWVKIVEGISKIVGDLRGSKRESFDMNTNLLLSCMMNEENGYIKVAS